jgi:hypothetical protein
VVLTLKPNSLMFFSTPPRNCMPCCIEQGGEGYFARASSSYCLAFNKAAVNSFCVVSS